VRHVQPPGVEVDPFAEFEGLLKAAVCTPPQGKKKRKADSRQRTLFAELDTLDDLIDRAAEEQRFSHPGNTQAELREYLSRRDDAAAELAEKLVELFEEDSDLLEAALRLLHEFFDILRIDLERNRPDAEGRMEQWQTALARHIYASGVNEELGAYVTQVLLDARVEILPLLHEANSTRMLESVDVDPDFAADPEQAMLDLLEELEQQKEATAFILFDAILQMMAVGDAEVQENLCRLMLDMEPALVRDAGVLMLFHPHAEVREKVVRLLAETDGRRLTPESLRRLIIARNWFPEHMRSLIDKGVANARRARVECAPLARRPKPVVYASAVDGALAQTFQVLVPEGEGFLCCSIMPKSGSGIADAFLVPLEGKRERNRLLTLLQDETGAIESSPEYLDQRVCQALADGVAQGKTPSHWLVAIAEQLGRDQWKAVPFDLHAELASLRLELEKRGGKLLDESYVRTAHLASAGWPVEQPFAWSWFEDDAEVDEVIRKAQGRKRRFNDERCLTAILDDILQPRRARWLERLVLTTQWAKAAKRSPVPWMQLYHVAAALADDKLALQEIPLMIAIAEHTLGAYFGRLEEGGG